MTSLARQLERLAVPHTQSVLAPDHRRVSLLFDPKEAANLDRETIFALGYSGLEELENLDETFTEYEGSLFNQSSQTWERTMQTRDVNIQLDHTIQRFLIQMSPYLMLRSAHKTLEWLVYRYHIHQFNVDDLLLCSLPFHDTKIFVRIIQMVKLSDPTNKWHWLEASGKNGVPLARGTLVNHCRSDPGFLAFICELLPKFIKVHGYKSPQLRPVIAMVTCSILASIQHRNDIKERMVSILVPHLVSGLRSKCVEYTMSSYMILSQLCSQTLLKEKVLSTLVPVITKKMKPTLSAEGIDCLAILYETQKITELPKKSFKHLCKQPGLVQILVNMSNKYMIPQLFRAFLNRLIPVAVEQGDITSYSSTEGSDDYGQGRPQYATMMLNILQDVTMETDLVQYVTKELLTKLLERRKYVNTQDAVNNWRMVVKNTLRTIESKYFNEFNETIKSLYEMSKKDEVTLNCLQEMTSLSMLPMKYQKLSDKDSRLMCVGLYHADVTMRVLAVRQLMKALQTDTQKVDPDKYIYDAVIARLHDDQYSVVEELLKFKEELLSFVCGCHGDDVKQGLQKVIEKGYGNAKWLPAVTMAIELLCTTLSSLWKPALMATMPYLLVNNKKNLFMFAATKAFIAGGMKHRIPIIEGWANDWLKLADSAEDEPMKFQKELNDIVVKGLTKSLLSCEGASPRMVAYHTATDPSFESPWIHEELYLCILVLVESLQQCEVKDRLDFACDVISTINWLSVAKLNCSQENVTTGKSQRMAWMDILHKKKKLPVGFVIWTFKSVCKQLAQIPIEEFWCSHDNQHHQLLIDMLRFVMTKCCQENVHRDTWREVMANWINMELSTGALFRICCLILTTSHDNVSALLKVGCYHLVERKLTAYEGDLTKLHEENRCVLPSLFIGLLSPHKRVRSKTLACLKILKKKSKNHEHGGLIKKLVKREEEILIDPLHTPQVIGSFYKDKSDVRDRSLCNLMLCIIANETPLEVKERLMALIINVHLEVKSGCVVVSLGNNLLSHLAEKVLPDKKELELTHAILVHILSHYNEVSAVDMKKDGLELKFLLMCLQFDVDKMNGLYQDTLKRITKDFFHALPSKEAQQLLISVILDTMVTHKASSHLVTKAMSTLRHMKLDGCHVQHELSVDEADIGSTVKSRKKTRMEVKAINYLRLTFILEVIENRKKVKDSMLLVAMLFSVLKRLLGESVEETEYCKQLVLTTLYNQCSRWDEKNKPQNQEAMNIELLVQCIRSSSSSQTQQQALLVMSAMAGLFPEYILHHVMSIFTFMGTNLLQQDNDHSFQVTVKTMETLIPAITQAKGAENSSDLVTQILQVFVDARHHIPKHRCAPLFNKVLQTVGVNQYSWVICVQVIESSVMAKDVPQIQEVEDIADKDKSTMDKDLDFLCNLYEGYQVLQRLHTTQRILEFLQILTGLNTESKGNSSSTSTRMKGGNLRQLYPLHVDTLSHQQLRLVQYNVTKLVVLLYSRQHFVTQILADLEQSNSKVKESFQSVVSQSLRHATTVAKLFGSHSNMPTGKFWKSLLSKVYEVLDKVNYLLPTRLFLELMAPMIQHEDLSVRRKAMELLCNKLQHLDATYLQEQQVEQLLSMVDTLLLILAYQPKPNENEADHVIIKQYALFSLKVMCKLLGVEHPKTFIKVFPQTVSLLSCDTTSLPVLGNCLLCIAELCTSLKAHTIPQLNKFMPPLLEVMGRIDLLKSNGALLVCSLTAIQRVLSSLPHFISPYLGTILHQVSKVACFVGVDTDVNKKSQPSAKLRVVRHHLATDIPSRVLLPALYKTYSDLLESEDVTEQEVIMCLLHIMKEHIEIMSKDDLSTHQMALRDFFCKVFDLRNEQLELSRSSVLSIEDLSIEAILSLVVRLSEMSFRPLYYRLYDWACREDTLIYKTRRITFFRLSQRLSSRLKSLFNMFVGHSIKMACQMLDQNNTYKTQECFFGDKSDAADRSCELVEYIMGMIYNCLLHDTDGFLTKDTFNSLVQPIVNQIENFLGGESQYSSRILQQVVPCISQLAAASRDDSAWKSLNYQVCLKTRHNSPKVRFATLQVIESIAQKLGDEYMTLLPETIPFLAELMEDESEEVEQQCQQVVTSLEQVLGESLQSYF